MKTRGRKKPGDKPEVFTINAESAEPDKPEESATGEKSKERFSLSFDLNDDGSPDLSSMRGKTKERVQAFFNDPKVASAFGAKPVATTPEVSVFHPTMVSGFYDALGAMEAMFIPMLLKKIDPAVAKKVFIYSSPEKEALSEPTVRVLNKLASEWMIKYQDYIALATILGAMTVQKIQLAIMLSGSSQAKIVEMPQKEASGTPVPN